MGEVVQIVANHRIVGHDQIGTAGHQCVTHLGDIDFWEFVFGIGRYKILPATFREYIRKLSGNGFSF